MKHLKKLNKEDKCFLVCYIFLTGATFRKSSPEPEQEQLKTVNQLRKNLHREYLTGF